MKDLSEITADTTYQPQVIASARTELYSKLNEDSVKVNYTEYTPDKLVRGKFGKIMYGENNTIEHVLLSDRFLARDLLLGYFYILSKETISCGGFDIRTGERHESCKVIEIEDISEDEAIKRYNQFLEVWKE